MWKIFSVLIYSYSIIQTATNFDFEISTTTDVDYEKESCGINTWCYDVDLYPLSGIETLQTINVNHIDDNAKTYFEIYFTINGNETCFNPTITVIYEEIDFDSTYEYFNVYDNTGSLIEQCSSGRQYECGSWATCINDESLGVAAIQSGDTYFILIEESDVVDALCRGYHDYTINLQLTFRCAAFPTLENKPYDNKTACGINRWCYYVDLFPLPNIETSQTIVITNIDDNAETYFDIYATINGNTCNDPSISVIYEEIDFSASSEYFSVYDNNGALIQQCSSGYDGRCGSWVTCIDQRSLGISQIKIGETYKITVFESSQINALCTTYHPYSINAELTITCSGSTAMPTAPTASPTTNPTTAIPTIGFFDSGSITQYNQYRCGRFSGATTYAYDINYYDFTVTTATNLTIDACNSTFDTWLYFQTVDGQNMTDCDDCGDCGVQTVLEIDDVAPGQYRIGIGGFSADYGSYIINVYCDGEAEPIPTSLNMSTTTDFANPRNVVIDRGDDGNNGNNVNIIVANNDVDGDIIVNVNQVVRDNVNNAEEK